MKLPFDLFNADGKPYPDAANTLKEKSFAKQFLLPSCGMFGNVIDVMAPSTVENEILAEGVHICPTS